jgi:hypothetical protein
MRAECLLDWSQVLKKDKKKLIFQNFKIESQYSKTNEELLIPDIEITFESSRSLIKIRDFLEREEDGHAMLESLNYENHYDGCPYYSVSSKCEEKEESYANYCGNNNGNNNNNNKHRGNRGNDEDTDPDYQENENYDSDDYYDDHFIDDDKIFEDDE